MRVIASQKSPQDNGESIFAAKHQDASTPFGSDFDPFLCTEQMDAEGLGRKLLLTPSGDPRRAPEKQTVGIVAASHKML